jgi:hypothetical protein
MPGEEMGLSELKAQADQRLVPAEVYPACGGRVLLLLVWAARRIDFS